jgi:hypothetical protein
LPESTGGVEFVENVFKPSVKLNDIRLTPVPGGMAGKNDVTALTGSAVDTVNEPVTRQIGGHWYDP